MATSNAQGSDFLTSYLRGMLFGMGAGMISGNNIPANVANLSALAFVVGGALWAAWAILRR